MQQKRNSFSSSIGFVLAAAGSAVGLGNIWRFPYLAAKDGGGLFLVVYIILALTFGFTMLVTEVSIGRKTKQSALTAYGKLHKKAGWIGGLKEKTTYYVMVRAFTTVKKKTLDIKKLFRRRQQLLHRLYYRLL